MHQISYADKEAFLTTSRTTSRTLESDGGGWSYGGASTEDGKDDECGWEKYQHEGEKITCAPTTLKLVGVAYVAIVPFISMN